MIPNKGKLHVSKKKGEFWLGHHGEVFDKRHTV